MPQLKLTYFDMPGGRGQTARLALDLGGVAYEDVRVTFADYRDRKASYPFAAVPTLDVDGVVVCQSNGINRYVGKLAGLYPNDPLQALFCDEAMDCIEDISWRFRDSLFEKDPDRKKALREALVAGPLPDFMQRLDRRLEARGGEWFSDQRMTVADLKVFVWARHIRSGGVDHVPGTLFETHAPRVLALYERIGAMDAVAAHYAKFGAQP